MKICYVSLLLLCSLMPLDADAHFNGKGHVHTLSETRQDFSNPNCRATGTCDLKRFTLTTANNEIWFSDDPNHPTYGTGAIMEYETDSIPALEKYVIVQFKKGCVFYSSKSADGQVRTIINDTVLSFDESVPYCFRNWVIDSQDSDPAYNSDPEYGRTYLARWNEPGSYDTRTQKYYGVEKPPVPIVYMTDYPSGAFIAKSGVKNTALEFKTCIYKASEVPTVTRREDVNFAKPLNCFDWQNVYLYDFKTDTFKKDLIAARTLEEPAPRLVNYRLPIFIALTLILAIITFLSLGYPTTKLQR